MPCAGEVGSKYSVIQDTTHQVSMRMKLGVLWDHNGTYIVRPTHSLKLDMRSEGQTSLSHCSPWLCSAKQALAFRLENPLDARESSSPVQDGIGFAYQGHQIVIELINGDNNDLTGQNLEFPTYFVC